MAIKILGGLLKGASLAVNERLTRPTGVMLKRKIFDSRQDLTGKVFIDLCAGSGSIGVEAHSRGARCVFLVESSKEVFRQLQSSIQQLKENRSLDVTNLHLSNTRSEKWLSEYLSSGATDTSDHIIFLDPPYEKINVYKETLDLIKDKVYKGEVWVEYDLKGNEKIHQEVELLFNQCGIKKYIHGQHCISVLDFA